MAVFCTDLQNFAECTTDSVEMRFYRKVGKTTQNSAFFRSLKGEIMSIRVLFVCHGNICRSPMAEFVMKDMVQAAGLQNKIYVESAATSTEEIGNPVYPPARRKLAEHGISCAGKTARQLRRQDYETFDLLIGMDHANLRNMRRMCGGDEENKIHAMMDYTNRPGEVADPWYTGNFEDTWRDVNEGCRGLLEQLKREGL